MYNGDDECNVFIHTTCRAHGSMLSQSFLCFGAFSIADWRLRHVMSDPTSRVVFAGPSVGAATRNAKRREPWLRAHARQLTVSTLDPSCA